MLLVVLNCGFGMSMIGKRRPRRIYESWSDFQVMFPYESKVTVPMINGQSTLLT